MSALRRSRGRPGPLPAALSAAVASAGEPMTVTIEAFDGDTHRRHEWEAVAWQPRPDRTPQRGDQCLVVMDELGRPWVVLGDWTGPEPGGGA